MEEARHEFRDIAGRAVKCPACWRPLFVDDLVDVYYAGGSVVILHADEAKALAPEVVPTVRFRLTAGQWEYTARWQRSQDDLWEFVEDA